jgi:hypothetical protein
VWVELRRRQIHSGEATMWLDSDRAGARAVEVRLAETCPAGVLRDVDRLACKPRHVDLSLGAHPGHRLTPRVERRPRKSLGLRPGPRPPPRRTDRRRPGPRPLIYEGDGLVNSSRPPAGRWVGVAFTSLGIGLGPVIYSEDDVSPRVVVRGCWPRLTYPDQRVKPLGGVLVGVAFPGLQIAFSPWVHPFTQAAQVCPVGSRRRF